MTAKQARELRFKEILDTIKRSAEYGYSGVNLRYKLSDLETSSLKKLGYSVETTITKVWGIFDSTDTITVISWE